VDLTAHSYATPGKKYGIRFQQLQSCYSVGGVNCGPAPEVDPEKRFTYKGRDIQMELPLGTIVVHHYQGWGENGEILQGSQRLVVKGDGLLQLE
jgi:hypothetical protein